MDNSLRRSPMAIRMQTGVCTSPTSVCNIKPSASTECGSHRTLAGPTLSLSWFGTSSCCNQKLIKLTPWIQNQLHSPFPRLGPPAADDSPRPSPAQFSSTAAR